MERMPRSDQTSALLEEVLTRVCSRIVERLEEQISTAVEREIRIALETIAKNSSVPLLPLAVSAEYGESLLSAQEVKVKVGLSRSTLWRLENDRRFPKRIRISKSRVAWKKSEIEKWIEERGKPRTRKPT